MKALWKSAAAVATAATLAIASPAVMAKDVELTVQYSQPQIFDGVFAALKKEFEAQNPGVRIVLRGPHKDYGAGLQALLREATIGDMPHVYYLGLSHLATVADRGLAVDLGPLAKADGTTLEAKGWTPSLQTLGQAAGKQLALPFAVSMPVVYVNGTLIRQVGGNPDDLPSDWNAILGLAGKVRALGSEYAGMYTPYSAGWYGAWYFQGVHFSHGGEMMQPGTTKVDLAADPVWRKSLGMYRRMVDEGGMLALPDQAQRQQFIAGRMGFFLDSISRLYNFETSIGDRFDLRVLPYPMAAANGRLPTGGNLGMVTTAAAKDPAVLAAAWKWLQFASGPYGTTQVIKLVGYTPVNVLALEDPALLKGYFDDRPRHRVAVDQIPIVREWYQYPGPQTLKIDDVIGEHLERIVDKSMTPEAALVSLSDGINKLLP